MILEDGYVQVYTGNGKGKTTAAIGIAIRMIGAGGRVFFQQYMKAAGYSEHKILSSISPNLEWEAVGKPYFIVKKGSCSEEELAEYKMKYVVVEEGETLPEYSEMMQKGLEKAAAALRSGEYDMVVLDEVNCALYYGLLSTEDVLDAIKNRAKGTEVILTGRMAPEEIIEAADLVTEMKEIKHYYTKGVLARVGVED